ncbi:MAG: class II aldolase/adducin family protein [Alphaproteobacteria bacterium]|nr:class II aldolase/adducin family protein [Alphaproteobacteria bacterium]
MADLNALRRDLAVANRILANEGVVDAYGHVSVRHPEDKGRFLLSRSRAPELVSPDDLMEFGLDGEVVDKGDKRAPYVERFIHAAVYEARPEIVSVIHNHSPKVVPFSVTKTPLRPLIHVAGAMGATIPVWDIREKFGDTNLLVANLDQGRDMTRALGQNTVVLMRGHGCTVASDGLKKAVITAVYVQVNATLQLEAMGLGEINFLTPGEVKKTGDLLNMPLVETRVWDYLASRCDRLGI